MTLASGLTLSSARGCPFSGSSAFKEPPEHASCGQLPLCTLKPPPTTGICAMGQRWNIMKLLSPSGKSTHLRGSDRVSDEHLLPHVFRGKTSDRSLRASSAAEGSAASSGPSLLLQPPLPQTWMKRYIHGDWRDPTRADDTQSPQTSCLGRFWSFLDVEQAAEMPLEGREPTAQRSSPALRPRRAALRGPLSRSGLSPWSPQPGPRRPAG
nr:uncharacterized protein LOC116278380 [Vicugna pacos]